MQKNRQTTDRQTPRAIFNKIVIISTASFLIIAASVAYLVFGWYPSSHQTVAVMATATKVQITEAATAAQVVSTEDATTAPSATAAATATSRLDHMIYIFDPEGPKVATPLSMHPWRAGVNYTTATNKALWVCSIVFKAAGKNQPYIRYVFESEVIDFDLKDNTPDKTDDNPSIDGMCQIVNDQAESHRVLVKYFSEAYDWAKKTGNKIWIDPDYQGNWLGWETSDLRIVQVPVQLH